MGDYYFIYKPYFKYSNSMGYVSEHRYIYHIYLSILNNNIVYIPRNMDIHHINNNKLDNIISNLQIMTNTGHSKLTGRNRQLNKSI